MWDDTAGLRTDADIFDGKVGEAELVVGCRDWATDSEVVELVFGLMMHSGAKYKKHSH